MASVMSELRATPPQSFSGTPTIAVEDLLSIEFQGDPKYRIGKDLPKADVLLYTLKDESKIIVRPSGTEPKIKVYCMLTASPGGSLEEIQKATLLRAEKLKAYTKEMLR